MGSYVAPNIGPQGLSIPTYDEIYDYYIGQYQAIYGADVSLDNSNADIQLIAIFALTLSDALNALQLDYNNRSPVYAIGAALDTLVKLNGLARKQASFSTCLVVLSGTPNTVVNNGVISDVNGNLWNLPTTVVIGGGGTVTVTATAQLAGAINVSVDQITAIAAGATAGWVSVSNGSNTPTVGQPIETDSQLRTRQAISTLLPSITLIAGTEADILAIPGVTRINVDENYTGSTNGNGTPAHSIQCVVEGGDSLAVATAIYTNKSIGCGTAGSTSVVVVDPNTGISNTIHFARPVDEPIYVIVNAHLLLGGTSATLTAIQTALVTYLNNLQIGERVSYGALIAVAMSVNTNLAAPVVSVVTLFFALTPTPTTIADLVLAFNQVAQGVTANVTVNSV